MFLIRKTHTIFPSNSIIRHEVAMSGKKNWSNLDKPFDIYGCKIQNTKVGSVPILLIQEKPIATLAIVQTQRNIVNLIAKSTQTKLKNFLRAPTCNYSTKFWARATVVQTPDLESCRAEAMLVCLLLNIVLLHKHMRLYETDCQKLCYTKKR